MGPQSSQLHLREARPNPLNAQTSVAFALDESQTANSSWHGKIRQAEQSGKNGASHWSAPFLRSRQLSYSFSIRKFAVPSKLAKMTCTVQGPAVPVWLCSVPLAFRVLRYTSVPSASNTTTVPTPSVVLVE